MLHGSATQHNGDMGIRAAGGGRAGGESPPESRPAAPERPSTPAGRGVPTRSETGLPPTDATPGGVAFEIERPKGDADEVVDPEQLNLF